MPLLASLNPCCDKLILAVSELQGLRSQAMARGCSVHCMGLSGNHSRFVQRRKFLKVLWLHADGC